MLRFNSARPTLIVRRAVFFACVIAFIAGAAYAQPRDDASRGAAKSAVCGSCHGTSKSPPLAGMPSLVGQQPEFLVLQMFVIREGLRDVPQMAGMLKGFSDQDLTDIAAYFTAETV